MRDTLSALPRDLPEHCVSTAVVSLVLRALGDASESLVERLPASVRATLRHPEHETYLSHQTLIAVIEGAQRLTRSPSLGLEAALGSKPGDLLLPELLARVAPTVGDAIEQLVSHWALVVEAQCSLTQRDGCTVLRIDFAEDLPVLPAVYELSLAAIYLIVARCVSGPRLALRAVELAHTQPRSTEAYERCFGVLPSFGAARNAITFEAASLRRPLVTAEPLLFSYLRSCAAQRLASLLSARSLRQQVSEHVMAEMSSGGGSRQGVARKLGMSASTLRRRLAEEGTSFAELADQARRQLARDLLGSRAIGVKTVATRLGFAHSSAFHRACRRWYGLAPRELRASLLASPLTSLAAPLALPLALPLAPPLAPPSASTEELDGPAC